MRPRYLYFLFDKKELVYIGITANIETRIKQHQKTKIFDDFKYMEVHDYHITITTIELELIKILKPRDNGDWLCGRKERKKYTKFKENELV